jgi:polysaccharide pyruvyl transferase WcaK-like protein
MYSKHLNLIHVGLHNSINKNAGDTVLFETVRTTFNFFISNINWKQQQLWEDFTVKDLENINNSFDGIVIGGGGLLLRDQEGSNTSQSGWQWNSSVNSIKKVQIPMIIFAIGYNRFRNQQDFDPIFSRHINLLLKKSKFFGLRNSGSIESLKKYLDNDLSTKLTRQFCPTTILWQLYPKYRNLAKKHDLGNHKVLTFNPALDRTKFRFGNTTDIVLKNIIRGLKIATDRGWRIIIVAHKSIDKNIEPILKEQNISYQMVNLTDATSEKIIKFYSKIDLAIGMRGHSQMIPFGLRRPIMSIISHDKMKFFLEDINKLEWGVEADSFEFEEKLKQKLLLIEKSRVEIHEEIAIAQQKIWEETKKNFDKIKRFLNKNNK